MPIIEGQPADTLPDFWFAPSGNQDQLRLAPQKPEHTYYSAVNGTGKEFWRHVAVVYKGFKDVQFYLNGSRFGNTIIAGDQKVFNFPDRLYLGNHPKFHFYGAMACVTIHEKALSQAEIEVLMETCP